MRAPSPHPINNAPGRQPITAPDKSRLTWSSLDDYFMRGKTGSAQLWNPIANPIILRRPTGAGPLWQNRWSGTVADGRCHSRRRHRLLPRLCAWGWISGNAARGWCARDVPCRLKPAPLHSMSRLDTSLPQNSWRQYSNAKHEHPQRRCRAR
jgi:hypothetical protein